MTEYFYSIIDNYYHISYADTFCIGLARDIGLPAITGDPEFDSVKNIVKVIAL